MKIFVFFSKSQPIIVHNLFTHCIGNIHNLPFLFVQIGKYTGVIFVQNPHSRENLSIFYKFFSKFLVDNWRKYGIILGKGTESPSKSTRFCPATSLTERRRSDRMSNHSPFFPDDGLLPLIQKAQAGSQSDFEELLRRYEPLIDSMTARFCGANATVQDREDLRQEAVLAFYRALQRFDQDQEAVSFGKFAKNCIRNGLVSYLRSIRRHKNLVLLEDGNSPDEAADANPAELVVEEESYLALSKQIHNTLSHYENRIWWLYLSGRTAKEIAETMGRSERSVQNAVYRIRRKLRAVIPNS